MIMVWTMASMIVMVSVLLTVVIIISSSSVIMYISYMLYSKLKDKVKFAEVLVLVPLTFLLMLTTPGEMYENMAHGNENDAYIPNRTEQVLTTPTPGLFFGQNSTFALWFSCLSWQQIWSLQSIEFVCCIPSVIASEQIVVSCISIVK